MFGVSIKTLLVFAAVALLVTVYVAPRARAFLPGA